MNPYLFVYGTLKHDSPHPMAAFLRQRATFIGEGEMPGRMFDLGAYPGAVFIENAQTSVHGHIFRMHDPAQVLPTLDRYEGIGASGPGPDEYVREVRPVTVGQEMLHCWVYLYNG